ncbi:sulfatase family protein [Marinoscillum furvescens]|uniref:Arylsulfatase A-like enzyme n=1 Tax=Marinoscillum furvescens DSM 4134 TaxID=1122208 RepID=A0A3D9L5G2_MARFU|nr:sulfatase [Marinoscillum furvescens]REE01149.1 arylsulfatase A-like enzyme [Marinoscillum furvescens DSM 4134]
MKADKPLFFLSLFLITLLQGCNVSKTGGSSTDARPNVIFIFPDQYRNASLGIWSKPEYEGKIQGKGDPVVTPALDEFASEAVVFSQALSNFPLCSPYRAMLISGMYPNNNGVEANCRKDRKASLKSDIEGVTDVFANNGYDVSYFGKVHWLKNDPLFDEHGTYVGSTLPPGGHYINDYDTYVPPGPDRHGIDYMYQVIKDVHFDPYVYSSDPKLIDGKSDGEQHMPGRFNAEIESEAIIKYLEVTHKQRDPEKPFFMMWSLNPPHNPWTEESTKMEYFDQYTENGTPNLDKLLTHENADHEVGHYAPYYFANVSAVDYYIGRVLDKLEELDLDDNTIIVFSSDHGEMLGSHGKQGKNYPEMESLNIPFMIKWGDRLKHRVEDRIVSVPDVMPTLLGLAGLENKIPESVQGEDFSDLVVSAQETNPKPEAALIMSYKYRGVFTGRYTFVVEEKGGKAKNVFCYDNEKDPYQLERIAPEQLDKELLKDLKTKLADLLVTTNDSWVERGIAKEYLNYN